MPFDEAGFNFITVLINSLEFSGVSGKVNSDHSSNSLLVVLKNIDPKIQHIDAGFAVKNIDIKTNAFHRYPILVTKIQALV